MKSNWIVFPAFSIHHFVLLSAGANRPGSCAVSASPNKNASLREGMKKTISSQCGFFINLEIIPGPMLICDQIYIPGHLYSLPLESQT